MPYILYVSVDASLIPFELVPQGLFYQLLSREHPSRIRCENIEHLEFGWCNVHRCPALLDLVAGSVYDNSAFVEAERGSMLQVSFLLPPQDSLNAINKLPRTKGLYDIIVSAKRKTCHPFLFGSLSRQHDY